MAFQAHAADVGTDEHFGVIGTVRFVTGLAVANAQGGVFEDEGAAFFGVTAQAGGLSGRGSANLFRVEAAVWLMAVGAAHGVFRDPVVEGAREVGFTLDVTAGAEGIRALLEKSGEGGAAVD